MDRAEADECGRGGQRGGCSELRRCANDLPVQPISCSKAPTDVPICPMTLPGHWDLRAHQTHRRTLSPGVPWWTGRPDRLGLLGSGHNFVRTMLHPRRYPAIGKRRSRTKLSWESPSARPSSARALECCGTAGAEGHPALDRRRRREPVRLRRGHPGGGSSPWVSWIERSGSIPFERLDFPGRPGGRRTVCWTRPRDGRRSAVPQPTGEPT